MHNWVGLCMHTCSAGRNISNVREKIIFEVNFVGVKRSEAVPTHEIGATTKKIFKKFSNFRIFSRGRKYFFCDIEMEREGSWLFLIQDPPIYIVFKMPPRPNPAQRTEYATRPPFSIRLRSRTNSVPYKKKEVFIYRQNSWKPQDEIIFATRLIFVCAYVARSVTEISARRYIFYKKFINHLWAKWNFMYRSQPESLRENFWTRKFSWLMDMYLMWYFCLRPMTKPATNSSCTRIAIPYRLLYHEVEK